MSPLDPFYFKQFRKTDPRRLAFTAYARCAEMIARMTFSAHQLPDLNFGDPAEPVPEFASEETAVTKDQMRLLIESVRATEDLGGAMTEIGAYRGATMAALAVRTSRTYYAVDPYIGYGGAEGDRLAMEERMKVLGNVQHLRSTSGQAVQLLKETPLSFVFVDAVHDYVNARFDGVSWGRLLCSQGLLAFHDTDSLIFPGVQRVVWKLANSGGKFQMVGHVKGLVVLRKC